MTTPNRFERVRRVLIWEQVAKAAMDKAATERAELDAAARKELEDEGTAPTWRIPDVGTVSLPVSVETVYVSNEEMLTEWCRHADPDAVEMVPRLRSDVRGDLLSLTVAAENHALIPNGSYAEKVLQEHQGELVPGLSVRAGGRPMSLRFLPSKDAKAVAAAGAQKLIEDVEKRIGGPVVLAEAPDA